MCLMKKNINYKNASVYTHTHTQYRNICQYPICTYVKLLNVYY